VNVPMILDKAVNDCSGDFGSGFPHYVGSKCWLLFTLYWIMLLVTVPFLDQNVGYCSHYFGLGCWLLFPFFYQSVGHCSYYFGSGC
jgi:hypothetical protein